MATAKKTMLWQTSRRKIQITRPLVMGILNVTPDSFSDGGKFVNVDDALRRVETMVSEGADIIDVGGESTRPGSTSVPYMAEIERTAPIIRAITERFDLPISIDTTKSAVGAAAIDSGAEILNDISGLRFDTEIGRLAAASGCGLVLMHSIGDHTTLHTSQKPVDAVASVICGLRESVSIATELGIGNEQIVLDVGIGFGKTPEQNFLLIANLERIIAEFSGIPFLIGASRKSFLKLVTGERDPTARVAAGISAAIASVERGASIIRTHDVSETADALRFIEVMNANA